MSNKYLIRKIHRYLGLFLGIQFVFWTTSGLYFSWTNIDDIHGDQFRDFNASPASFTNLISPSMLKDSITINSVELRDINGTACYWINKKLLYNATTGTIKNGITKNEALSIAHSNMQKGLIVKSIALINTVGNQHEYREKFLPAYVISYQHSKNVKAYVSANDGSFKL